MDINPATRGHALVIPRAPRRRSDRDQRRGPGGDDGRRPPAGGADARDACEPAGFNLVNSCGAAAWQTVFHFHVHVVPRYEGDPLELPWVPAPGDPDEIAAAADQIRGAN